MNRSIAPPLSLRRLAGTAGLLAIVAFLAGITATAGGALIARAAVERARVPREARYFAIVRSALADSAGDALALLPGVRVVAQRGLSELLAPATMGVTVPDRLRVVELAAVVPVAPDDLALTAEALAAVDGVVDVIDLNAAERAEHTAAGARRWLAGGLLLALVGCGAFVLGVARASAVAVRDASEELTVRVLLGADPPRLWVPFGAWLGLAACVGVGGALLAMALAARFFTPLAVDGLAAGALPAPWPLVAAASGGIALVLGACAIAALSARQAVDQLAFGRRRERPRARPAAAPAAAAAAIAVLCVVVPARGSAEEAAADATHLRQLNRDLAVARRALHQAETSLLGSEHRAIRAVASGDEVAVRLAAAQLAIEAQQVERWRASRDTLIALRSELRAQRTAERAPGPPIAPRLRPVRGVVAAGFRQTPVRGGLRGFRNGVALRMGPGELVRATAAGRVAYAAELAGAGPIVVLSHGRRTYTVYGRVSEILVARGMHVEPGEPIARAPDQAGLLYFAVRERNRPIDPVRWLKVEDDGGSARSG